MRAWCAHPLSASCPDRLIQALKFGRGNKSIVGMVSSEKESFDFKSPVPIEGAVEVWMTAAEAEMRRTLYQITKEGVFYYAKTARWDWCSQFMQCKSSYWEQHAA